MKSTAPDPSRLASVSTVLRIGLGIVFLVFGLWKASEPVQWVIFLPNWVSGAVAGVDFIDPLGALRMMGFVEFVMGFQLLIGLFTRATAAACGLFLAGIVFHVGFDQVGIRDAGLLFAAAALSISGAGPWSVDQWLSSKAAVETEI